MLVVTPEADDEGVAAAVQRTADLIGARGGMVTEQERWGLRRLAYPINGYVEGHYALMRFACGVAHTRELERNLIAAEDVLRHLITTVEREADLEALQAEAAAAQDEPEATEQAEAAVAQDEPEASEQAEAAVAQDEPEASEQAEAAVAQDEPGASEQTEAVAAQDEPEASEQAEAAAAQDEPQDETPPPAQDEPSEQAEPAPTADEEPAVARPTA
jgi:small subunit ribosomal protein S6